MRIATLTTGQAVFVLHPYFEENKHTYTHKHNTHIHAQAQPQMNTHTHTHTHTHRQCLCCIRFSKRIKKSSDSKSGECVWEGGD
jgi:ABC-type nickel/cobalt efflux system permease component RcnA